MVKSHSYSTVFMDYILDFCVHTLQDIRGFRIQSIYRERTNTVRRRYEFYVPVMSRTERKYCLTSTSYLAGLFDIFRLLHV